MIRSCLRPENKNSQTLYALAFPEVYKMLTFDREMNGGLFTHSLVFLIIESVAYERAVCCVITSY